MGKHCKRPAHRTKPKAPALIDGGLIRALASRADDKETRAFRASSAFQTAWSGARTTKLEWETWKSPKVGLGRNRIQVLYKTFACLYKRPRRRSSRRASESSFLYCILQPFQ